MIHVPDRDTGFIDIQSTHLVRVRPLCHAADCMAELL